MLSWNCILAPIAQMNVKPKEYLLHWQSILLIRVSAVWLEANQEFSLCKAVYTVFCTSWWNNLYQEALMLLATITFTLCFSIKLAGMLLRTSLAQSRSKSCFLWIVMQSSRVLGNETKHCGGCQAATNRWQLGSKWTCFGVEWDCTGRPCPWTMPACYAITSCMCSYEWVYAHFLYTKASFHHFPLCIMSGDKAIGLFTASLFLAFITFHVLGREPLQQEACCTHECSLHG